MYVSSIIIFTHSGIAPVTNTMATVTVDGLECGVTYTIIAGGILNGELVGPRSSHGTIATNPCPVCPATSKINKCSFATCITCPLFKLKCSIFLVMYRWLNAFYCEMSGYYRITLFFGSNSGHALLVRPVPSVILIASIIKKTKSTFM